MFNYQIGMTIKHKESGSVALVVAVYGDSYAVQVIKAKGGYHKGDNALWLKSLCVEA